MVEMAEMDDVGPERADDTTEGIVDTGVTIAVSGPRHVHEMQPDAIIVGVALAALLVTVGVLMRSRTWTAADE